MHLNQNQQGHLAANNQAIGAQSLLVFEKYKSNELCYSIFQKDKKAITLLDQFDIFKYIPKNFTITTKKGSYIFNDEMLKDTSSIINKFITNNPDKTEYFIDIDDEKDIMSKIVDLYNGKKVSFKEDELNDVRQLTSSLNLTNIPKFMKFDRFKHQEYPRRQSYFKNRMVIINMTQFQLFLEKNYPKTFTISTNNQEYKCNMIGVKSSAVIEEQFGINPSLDSFHFDFDDSCNVFQEICNFFNLMPIKITIDNMHVLKKMVGELKIDCLVEEVNQIIKSYESAVQKIDEKHILIDSVVELCNNLYNIRNEGIENVKEEIIKSKWLSTEENVQELVCYLIQVVNNNFDLHSYIIDLLELLGSKSAQIIPYFIKQILFSFPYNKVNCSFVFRLIQKGYVSIDDIVNKIIKSVKMNKRINESVFFRSAVKDPSDKEKFISKLTNVWINNDSYVGSNNLKNAIVWFFPELLLKEDKEVNAIIKSDHFIKNYLPDGIERFKKMRESYEPDDEISKLIIHDDVDNLQKILSSHPNLQEIIPYNLFDSINENGNNSFINYAAANGSIKCFKYLLLNHATLDESSFYYAALGQNVEIIRIVDQKNLSINYKFNSDDHYIKLITNHYDRISDNSDKKAPIQTPIIPAIIRHNNDLFDWILEQKYINNGITCNALFDVAILAVQNGNAHAFIQCVDKGFDLSSLFLNKVVKLLQQSSSYGYFKMTQLIISLLLPEQIESCFPYSFSLENAILSGNLSITKLFFSYIKKCADITKSLCTAIEREYFHIIKSLFETNMNEKIEFTQQNVVHVFFKAIELRRTEIFNYLITKTPLGFILEANSLFVLLSYSCYLGYFEGVQSFTELILMKKINKDFSEPFMYAGYSGHDKICQYFIDKKVLIDYSKLATNASVLTCCNKAVLNILFDSSDPEGIETFLGKLLDEAIKNQNVKVVEFLLEKGSPYDYALFEAVSSNNLEIVNIVLSHNSKPSFINRLSKDGTALNKAVTLKEYEIVKRLLSIPGIDPSLYADKNVTPLVSAIASFDLDIINLILDFYGDEIELQKWQLDEAMKAILRILSGEENSSNPFFGFKFKLRSKSEEEEEKIETKNKKKKKFILTVLNRLVQIKNIDLNCRVSKYTLLTYACETNEIDMVKMLVNSGKVDINSYAPKNGNTPLMISIENKNTAIAKLLIESPNTNINIRNYNRKTALIIAVEKGLDEIVNLIVNNEKFDPDESRLDYAFYISEGEMANKLFSLNNLNVNYKNVKNESNCRGFNDDHYYDHVLYYKKKQQKETKPYLFKTTLINAVNKKDQKKIDLIVNHSSFNPIKSQVKLALFTSVKINDIQIFKSLLSLIDNDVNIVSQSNESLLSYSIRCGSNNITEEIINNEKFDSEKADILSLFLKTYSSEEKEKERERDNDENEDEYKLKDQLFDAQLETMKLLCKFDENHQHLIDFTKLLPNNKSFFTIMSPDLKNSDVVANFFLEHGVDPDAPDGFNEYPLKYVMENSLVGAALVLIRSQKVDLKRRFILNEEHLIMSKSENSTYLHLAACLQTPEILSELLDLNVIDINCRDEKDESPVVKAIKQKSLENIHLLFSKDNLDYKCCCGRDIDVIQIAKAVVDYDYIDEVHLESKEDYLDYLIQIIESR